MKYAFAAGPTNKTHLRMFLAAIYLPNCKHGNFKQSHHQAQMIWKKNKSQKSIQSICIT